MSDDIKNYDLVAILDETGSTNAPGREEHQDFAFGCVFVPTAGMSEVLAGVKRLSALCQRTDLKYSHVVKNADARALYLRMMRNQDLALTISGLYVAGAGIVEEAVREFRLTSRKKPANRFHSLRRMVRRQDQSTAERLAAAAERVVCRIGFVAKHRNAKILMSFDRRSDLSTLLSGAAETRKILADIPHLSDCASLIDVRAALPSQYNGLYRLSDLVAGDIRRFFRLRGDLMWPCLKQEGIVISNAQVGDSPILVDSDLRMGYRRTYDEDDLPKDSSCLLGDYTNAVENGCIEFVSPNGICGDVRFEPYRKWSIFQHPEIDWNLE